MDKSPDAFRTISEVGEVLETPAHVLRFWESRFPQIRPVKRAGGRRYYRPADVALLTGIKHLLHDEGMTIRGVQKILREQGVRYVAGLSGADLPDETEDAEAALEAALAANFGSGQEDPTLPQAEVETAQVVALETALRARDADGGPKPESSADILPLFDIADQTPIDIPDLTGRPAPTSAPEDAKDVPEEVPEAAHWIDPELDDPGAEDRVAAHENYAPENDAAEDEAIFARARVNVATPDIAPVSAFEPYLALPADAPLIDRLRALPAGSLAASTDATALRNRLAALVARLASAPPQAPL